MPIKVIPINNRLYPLEEKSDCMVLRKFEKDSTRIDIAFPFHEDTPNFNLTISEALDLRNAIDQLIDIKMLERPRRKRRSPND
ncbi:hypothetical protein [Siminovitchia terrae]|uniref:hypothetical protein n=1 Tax=Siminovitchia terrae TaxID=1914933 RepID=UPI0028A83969|nr:hypothetical protein [Siminovitchia terrae]